MSARVTGSRRLRKVVFSSATTVCGALSSVPVRVIVGFVDGRHLALQPGLAKVGLHRAHLLHALGVNLGDHRRADGFGGSVDIAHDADHVAHLDVRGLELLRGIAAAVAASCIPPPPPAALATAPARPAHPGALLDDAGVGAEMDGVHVAGVGLDGVVVCRNLSHGAHQAAAHHSHRRRRGRRAGRNRRRIPSRNSGRAAQRGAGILSNGCGSESNSNED